VAADDAVAAGVVARAAFVVATAVVLGASLRELGARVARRAGGETAAEAADALAGDADLAAERASARLDAGDVEGARRALATALASRPRDPWPILLAASTTEATPSRLAFALVAARFAPYDAAPARLALAVAIEAAEAGGARAATARETARRLRAAGVTEGVDDAEREAARLELDVAAALDAALAVHGATSPTARGMRFLDEDAARVRAMLRDIEGGR
jgi:hypothetical protein